MNHKQDYLLAMQAGVTLWSMPIVRPDHWHTVVSNAGAIASGAGSIMTVAAGTLLVPLGVAFLAAGIAASIYSLVTTIEREEEEYRQKKLEREIKRNTQNGYFRVAERIESQADVLSSLCAVEALKAGISPERIQRGGSELDAFVWEKLFGKFPENLEKGRDKVLAEMNSRLNRHFSR